MSTPLSDPEIRAEIERRALVLVSETAGKLSFDLNLKDGRWTISNVSVTFPRSRTT